MDSHVDATLRAYARSYMLQAGGDPAKVDAYLDSAPFHTLVGGFHRLLEKAMHEFPDAPAALVPDPDVPMPLPLKDLALADETALPEIPAPAPVVAPVPPLPDIGFRLPNARAGEAYRQPLEAVPPSADKVVYCELTTPGSITLAVDQTTGIVTGTPDAAGDYPLTVAYHFASEAPAPLRYATVQLTVNPDPKKMWQDLPAPLDAPYPTADTDAASLADSQFSILAASKRGRSHAHVGSFRDDAFRIAQVPGVDGNWQLAVLADGAGSAKFSRQGAAIICDQAIARLTAALQGTRVDEAVASYHRDSATPDAATTLRAVLSGIVGNAAYYAAKGIMDECAAVADTLGAVPKDYASTALIAICKRYPFGTLCAAYWVGDGAIGVYSDQDGITLLGDVDSGEFSGQTRFLEAAEVSQEALLRRTRFVLVPHLTALVLMTDGVSDPRFETEARLARPADWHALWTEFDRTLQIGDAAPGKEQLLLAWLDFWSPGNHDDRTIALITPLNGNP